MMLCVVGDADADAVLKACDEVVQKTPYKKAETILPEEGAAVKEEFFERKMSVANPIFAIGFKEDAKGDVVECQALYNCLLEYVFGKTSALYNRLYDGGDIFALNASFGISKGCAFVEVTGEAENPKKVYEEIKREIESVRQNGFDEEEVTILKNALYGKFLRKLNDVESIASDYVANAFLGGDYLKYGECLLDVTAKKLSSVLEKGFCESVLSQILPVDGAGDK